MKLLRLLPVLVLGSITAVAQEGRLAHPPNLPDATVEVYNTVGETRLNLYVFNPSNGTAAGKRAAIVFFFGGGWRQGSPAQFAMQCRRLASLGMVAITADYRVSSRNHTTAADAVRDAKAAIRYIRGNAARLGIDPERIAAGGGSAGGHLALSTALIPGLDEDSNISSRPDALVLFNPGLLAPGSLARSGQIPELKGVDAVSVSPWHHVSANAPPTIIFHSTADTTVPYVTVQTFAKRMQAAGNRCELTGFDGQNHGFFNYSPDGNRYYDETLHKAEEFLASIGYLKTQSPVLHCGFGVLDCLIQNVRRRGAGAEVRFRGRHN